MGLKNHSMKNALKISLILLLPLLFSSCELLLVMAGPNPAENIISDLELCSSWRGNLVGQTVVEGKIRNKHYRDVWNIRLAAVVYDRNGQAVEEKQFDVSVTITPDGSATFKEYMSTDRKNVGDANVKIIDARD